MPGPVPNRAPRRSGTSFGTFRSAKIRTAQQTAYAKRKGYMPTGYVSKADRAKQEAARNIYAGYDDDYAGYAEEQMEKKAMQKQVRQTPYNPAKGQTDRAKDYQ